MAPYFQVLPVPAGGLPINAAIVATQHFDWSVRVVDGKTEIPSTLEGLGSFSAGTYYVLVRPQTSWPADRELQIIATRPEVAPGGGRQAELRHRVRTGKKKATQPPTCAWTGPLAPEPRGFELPDGMWPTNTPRPPRNQRTFNLAGLASGGNYLVAVRAKFVDEGEVSWVHGSLQPGQSSEVAVAPVYPREDISDGARIVGVELEDMAGNVARYGDTSR